MTDSALLQVALVGQVAVMGILVYQVIAVLTLTWQFQASHPFQLQVQLIAISDLENE